MCWAVLEVFLTHCAGAYTMAGSCDFNGFDVTTGVPFFYVTSN